MLDLYSLFPAHSDRNIDSKEYHSQIKEWMCEQEGERTWMKEAERQNDWEICASSACNTVYNNY